MPAFLFLLLRVRNVRHHKGAACLAQSHNSSSPRACDSSRGWRCYRSCSTKARTETVCYRKRCGTEFTGGFVTKGFRHICPFVCTATPPPLALSLALSLSVSLSLSHASTNTFAGCRGGDGEGGPAALVWLNHRRQLWRDGRGGDRGAAQHRQDHQGARKARRKAQALSAGAAQVVGRRTSRVPDCSVVTVKHDFRTRNTDQRCH